MVGMGQLSLRLGLGLESESQRFYKRLKLESEFCLEDSDSSPSLAEKVESDWNGYKNERISDKGNVTEKMVAKIGYKHTKIFFL